MAQADSVNTMAIRVRSGVTSGCAFTISLPVTAAVGAIDTTGWNARLASAANLALALRMRLVDLFDGFCDRASSLFIRADASGRSRR